MPVYAPETIHLLKYLILLFILIPLAEIYVLIKVGTQIGALPTLLLILLMAVLGSVLFRIQGFITLVKIRHALDQGELPALALVEGLILLGAGVLLLIPGFISDVLAFICLLPVVRRALATLLLDQYFVHRKRGTQPVVIEGEFIKVSTNKSLRQDKLDS